FVRRSLTHPPIMTSLQVKPLPNVFGSEGPTGSPRAAACSRRDGVAGSGPALLPSAAAVQCLEKMVKAQCSERLALGERVTKAVAAIYRAKAEYGALAALKDR